jgi:Viral coat protein (S domain)
MPRKYTKKPSASTEVKKIVSALNSLNMKGRGAYRSSTTRPYKPAGRPTGGAVSGRGFYKGFGADLGRHIGGLATSMSGIPGLSMLGERLGRMGAKATGWGAYKVHHNSLIADIPVIANPNKEGATQVRHREYIGDIVSTGGFQIQYQLPINAGLPSTFPWESVVGSAYQQYQVNGMIFEFISTSGDTTAGSTALGSVCMATQYDSALPPFVNKLQILNQEFSTSVKPSVNGIHPIECAPSQTSIPLLYTRTGVVPAGTDQRLYDLGVFYLATEGQQGAGGDVIGELWVTYDLLLYKPQLTSVGPDTSPSGLSRFSLTNTGRNNLPFGSNTSAPVELENPFGLQVSTNTITFPSGSVGKYMISGYWHGAVSRNDFAINTYPASVSRNPQLFASQTAPSDYTNGNLASEFAITECIEITTPLVDPAVITFQSFNVVGSGDQWTSGDLLVVRIVTDAPDH